MTDQNQMPKIDRELLTGHSQIVSNNGDGAYEMNSPVDFVTRLASITPQADESFRQQLEERLLTDLQRRARARVEARPPVEPGRLRSVWQRLHQILSLQGDMTMKKAVTIAASLILAFLVSTLALVPSVRAEIVRVIQITLDGHIDDFFTPTYIPDGFQSGFLTLSGSNTNDDETDLDQMELRYHKGQQFIVINQRRAESERPLPAGQSVTVQGYDGILIEGLAGTVQVAGNFEPAEGSDGEKGQRISPQQTQEDTEAWVKVKSPPIFIEYSDGCQLTWYTDQLRVEILTNLSEAELFKIAEGLKARE